MGLQKYRADRAKETMPNGAIPWYSDWQFGPSLALIRDCPIDGTDMRRTVYIQGDADTFFSQPAACKIKGKTVRGSVINDGDVGLIFCGYKV